MFELHHEALLINQLRHPSLHFSSQVLVKLLPIWGSFVSLSDPNFKHKWQVIRSSSLFHVRCSSSPKIQSIDASQAAKSLAQKTVLLISKKGASCVSFGDRLKMRKLLRLVPWATDFEHHVAQNLGKEHLPKSMKVEVFQQKYKFTSLLWATKITPYLLLRTDFHVQCQLFKIYLINQLRRSSLHKAAKILWSCSHTEAVLFHFQTLLSNTSHRSSSLFHFKCSSNEATWMVRYRHQIDGN